MTDPGATQLNLHAPRNELRTNDSLDGAAIERRLEEGAMFRHTSLKNIAPVQGYEIEPERPLTLGLSLPLKVCGWVLIFLASALISHTVRVGGFTPAWLANGTLAVALMKFPRPASYWVAMLLLMVLIGTAMLDFEIKTSLFSSAISFVSSILLSTVVRRVAPACASGSETLRETVYFLLVVISASLLDACVFALPLHSLPALAETSFDHIVLRLFVGNMVGTLIVMPFFMSITEEKFLTSMLFWKTGHTRAALMFLASVAAMVALPFAFITVPEVLYRSSMYYMLPLAIASGYLAGVPGLCLNICLGFIFTTYVSTKYRYQTSAHSEALELGPESVNHLLRLQLWTISLLGGCLLLTATVSELHVCQTAIGQLHRDIERGSRDSWKRGSGPVTTESSLILAFVCNELVNPMRKILNHCDALIDSEAGSIQEASAIAAREVSGRSIKRLGEQMLPIIDDATELARVANGTDSADATLVDINTFMEDLVMEIRQDLANARIETRFNLPRRAAVDCVRLRRIFRAMVINACKHRTSRSKITIDALSTACYARMTDKSDMVDIDISITVTDFVIENAQVDLLIRPYAHQSVPGSRDLSLAIATVLARSMGGRIVVYGQTGRGTIYNCKLPTKIDMTDGDNYMQTVPSLPRSKAKDNMKAPHPKAPLLKQLTVAASNAAEMSKSLGKRWHSANLRRRSKDSTGAATPAGSRSAAHEPSPLASFEPYDDETSNPQHPSNPHSTDNAESEIIESNHTGSDLVEGNRFEDNGHADICEIVKSDDYPNGEPERKLVLVVDDSRVIRLILLRMLGEYPDLEVHEASNGEEAFAACMCHPYCLILMDLVMPEMDGFEAARRMRQEGITAPIVITTAYVEQAGSFRRSGIDQLMAKPITKEKISRLLNMLGITRGLFDEHLSPSLTAETDGTHVASHESSPQMGYFDVKQRVASGDNLTPHNSSITSSNAVLMNRFAHGSLSGSLSSSSLNSGGRPSGSSSLPRGHQFARDAPILIVDDNPISRRLLKAQLNKLVPGREIVEGSDGRDAVALCGSGQKFAIIYTDLTMPGMDGHVAAARIRSMRAISGGPPIVAVTGHVLDGESFQGIRSSGINDAITKPVSKEALMGTLRTYGILRDSQVDPSDSAMDSPTRAAFPSELTAPGMLSSVERRNSNSSDMVDGARSVYRAHLQRTRSVSQSDAPTRLSRASRRKSREFSHYSTPADTGTPLEGDMSRPLLRFEFKLDAKKSSSLPPSRSASPDIGTSRGRGLQR
ncbi:hypothetical protein DFJ77DRAFT_481234 [Powellomyces hirtus]|nr:hypothetical protein DFJ77DRAFT_481234 [Powellomyces hirtus]